MWFGGRQRWGWQGLQGGEDQVDMRSFYTFIMSISMAISVFWVVPIFLVDLANFVQQSAYSDLLNNSGGAIWFCWLHLFINNPHLNVHLASSEDMNDWYWESWIIINNILDVQDVTHSTTNIHSFYWSWLLFQEHCNECVNHKILVYSVGKIPEG